MMESLKPGPRGTVMLTSWCFWLLALAFTALSCPWLLSWSWYFWRRLWNDYCQYFWRWVCTLCRFDCWL